MAFYPSKSGKYVTRSAIALALMRPKYIFSSPIDVRYSQSINCLVIVVPFIVDIVDDIDVAVIKQSDIVTVKNNCWLDS